MWTVSKVVVITVVWIGIFLATLIGYLTVPILVLGAFISLYVIIDSARARPKR